MTTQAATSNNPWDSFKWILCFKNVGLLVTFCQMVPAVMVGAFKKLIRVKRFRFTRQFTRHVIDEILACLKKCTGRFSKGDKFGKICHVWHKIGIGNKLMDSGLVLYSLLIVGNTYILAGLPQIDIVNCWFYEDVVTCYKTVKQNFKRLCLLCGRCWCLR